MPGAFATTPRSMATPDAGLPPRAGIGLKAMHLDALLADPEPPGFVEVHAENHLGPGGAWLEAVQARLPISVHGVGLSIGGAQALDMRHLDRVAALLDRCGAASFSEHLAWSGHGGRFFNDLLPLPYTARTLHRVCAHIDQVQARLGRRILLENPATYLGFAGSDIDEPDFIAGAVRRTGCGLLLDVNNLYVSCVNHRRDPLAYLAGLPLAAVGEIHLAGHSRAEGFQDDPLLIDDHGAPVDETVWALYRHALDATGPVATLIEWDNALPAYAVLREEARRAERLLAALRKEAVCPT